MKKTCFLAAALLLVLLCGCAKTEYSVNTGEYAYQTAEQQETEFTRQETVYPANSFGSLTLGFKEVTPVDSLEDVQAVIDEGNIAMYRSQGTSVYLAGHNPGVMEYLTSVKEDSVLVLTTDKKVTRYVVEHEYVYSIGDTFTDVQIKGRNLYDILNNYTENCLVFQMCKNRRYHIYYCVQYGEPFSIQ